MPRYSDSPTREALGIQRARKIVSQREQSAEERALLINALREQRAKLIESGAMQGALPHLHDAMGPRDIVSAQNAMNGLKKNPNAGQYVKAEKKDAPVKPETPLTSQELTTSMNAGDVGDVQKKNDQAMKDVMDGKKTMDEAAREMQYNQAAAEGNAALRERAKTNPSPITPSTPTGLTPGSPEAMASGIKSLPFANGNRLPADAVVNVGPGGASVMMESESGPRAVSFQPTFEQVMEGKSGGKWSQMTPAERSNFLKTTRNPTGQGGNGQVIDTGKTAPTFDGFSTHQTPNGPTKVYDPRDDKSIIQAPTAPGADRSIYIPSKYTQDTNGNGVASVSYGPARTGMGRIFDESGDVTPAATVRKTAPVVPAPVAAVKAPRNVFEAAINGVDAAPGAVSTATPPLPGAPTPKPSGLPVPAAATAAPPQASLGSDILNDFTENEAEKQFQKTLRFGGFSRGALT